MPHLFDILDRDEYARALDGRYIKAQSHPTLPLIIHNYTDAATWDEHWTNATLTCRGLVTDAETGNIVARPFKKFFNHDQTLAPVFGLDEPVHVFDKADGSLGILVPTPDGHIIATRGSFVSDQATWATQFYQRTYANTFTPNPAWTYLFEIVYPDNRIVVDYGAQEDLILLGAIDIASGQSVPLMDASAGWPGPVVAVFPYATLADVLAAPEVRNAEGFVIWHPERDERVKVKFVEYKRLHKLLTGINTKHVWEILAAGKDPAAEFASAPDEFHGWLRGQMETLFNQYEQVEQDALAAFHDLVDRLPVGFDRRTFAEAAAHHPLKVYLFLLLDERNLSEAIWKTLRPVNGGQSVRLVTSDAD